MVTKLWEGLGTGLQNLKKGTFSYVPEPKCTDYKQKYPCTASRNAFFVLVKKFHTEFEF